MDNKKAMSSGMALAEVRFEGESNRQDTSVIREAEPRHIPDRVSGTRLVSPFKSDHDARVAELLRSNFRDVWRMVRRFGVPESSADDAAQEVFIVASRRLPDIAAGSERPFLLATAVRVAANVRRSLGTRRECAEDEASPERVDPRPNADVLLDQKRLRIILDRVLDTLSDDLRVSFVLYELEGLSSPEIADLLSIPVGTVASRLRRGREAFDLAVGRIKADLAERGSP